VPGGHGRATIEDMGGDMLTTWGVVLELDPVAGGERGTSAADWFADGRGAFFDRCPRLAAFLRSEDARLRTSAEHFEPLDIAPSASGVRIGVSVVEVRLTSFTMAVRIRWTGTDAAPPANGRCTVAIEHRVTGERIPIPREVRDEFVAIQLGARDLC
jgi:acyl-CoA thioesterase FadM